MFRKLRADEIECRVSRVVDKGLWLLLYKDARVDQRILDETVGPFKWQRSHRLIGENLYCTVSIFNETTGEWVSKEDVGTESNTEKEKGQASDSFKRACFNWGIGRELYTAPQVFIRKEGYKEAERGGTYDRFVVDAIGYDENGSINHLRIKNKNSGKVVFEQGAETMTDKVTEGEIAVLRGLCLNKGLDPAEVFNIPMEELTKAQYAEAVRRLK